MTDAAPRHLSADTRRWWRAMIATYGFEPENVELLRLAAEALDRGRAARVVVDRDGVTTFDRFGVVKPHPMIAVAHAAADQYARLVDQMNLPAVPPPATMTNGRARAVRPR